MALMKQKVAHTIGMNRRVGASVPSTPTASPFGEVCRAFMHHLQLVGSPSQPLEYTYAAAAGVCIHLLQPVRWLAIKCSISVLVHYDVMTLCGIMACHGTEKLGYAFTHKPVCEVYCHIVSLTEMRKVWRCILWTWVTPHLYIHTELL